MRLSRVRIALSAVLAKKLSRLFLPSCLILSAGIGEASTNCGLIPAGEVWSAANSPGQNIAAGVTTERSGHYKITVAGKVRANSSAGAPVGRTHHSNAAPRGIF